MWTVRVDELWACGLLYQSPAETTHMFHSAQLLQNMPTVCLMQTCTQNLKDSGSLSRHNHLSHHESTAWPYQVDCQNVRYTDYLYIKQSFNKGTK